MTTDDFNEVMDAQACFELAIWKLKQMGQVYNAAIKKFTIRHTFVLKKKTGNRY